MGLSSELASQFAKVTNDSSRNTNGTKLYGTIAMLGEVPHVKLDGTEELTPISRTVEVAEGDRVEVMIANHSATVTGNLTDPSIGVVRAGNLESKITQTAEEIRLEVSNLGQNLKSSIDQTASEIRTEVSDLDGRLSENVTNIENGIREDLSNSITSLSSEITALEDQTSQINASIESLTFNVSELDSKITQTATEIRSEVSAKVTDLNATIVDTETGIRDTINVEVANLDSKITQTATSIQTEVSAKFETVDGEIEKFSKFKQTVEGFSFMGTGGTVKISGGDITITGTKAKDTFNLTGAITFTDLDSETQGKINDATTTANNAKTVATNAQEAAVSAQSIAESAESLASTASTDASDAYDAATSAKSVAKSIANGKYVGGTFIDGNTIQSPIIEGNEIRVYGTFQTMYNDGITPIATGYMGAAQGKALSNGEEVDSYGVAIARTWNSESYAVSNSYVIVTEYGVRLQYKTNSLTVSADGIWLTVKNGKAFYNNNEIGSGAGGTGGTAVFG